MAQTFFQEPHEDTFLPKGYISFFDGMDQLARSHFADAWLGELEYQYRNFEYEYRSATPSHLAMSREMIAAADEPATRNLLTDDAALGGIIVAMQLEAEQHLIDAASRYAALVDMVRRALVAETLVAVGVSDNGIEVPLLDTHWRGPLAVTVLYKGKCCIDGPSFVFKSNQLLFVMFKKSTLNGFISGRTATQKRTKAEENALAYKWIYALIDRSRHKKEHGTEEYRKNFNLEQNAKVSRDRWYVQWNKCVEKLNAHDPWSRPGTREK